MNKLFDLRSIAIGIFLSTILIELLSKTLPLSQSIWFSIGLGFICIFSYLIINAITELRRLRSLYKFEQHKTEEYFCWIKKLEILKSDLHQLLNMPDSPERDDLLDEFNEKYEKINKEFNSFKGKWHTDFFTAKKEPDSDRITLTYTLTPDKD